MTVRGHTRETMSLVTICRLLLPLLVLMLPGVQRTACSSMLKLPLLAVSCRPEASRVG